MGYEFSKYSVWKILGLTKILNLKLFGSTKNYGSKTIVGQKKNLVLELSPDDKKIVGPKSFCQKRFGPKLFFGSNKNFWVKENFRPKNSFGPEKNLGFNERDRLKLKLLFLIR